MFRCLVSPVDCASRFALVKMAIRTPPERLLRQALKKNVTREIQPLCTAGGSYKAAVLTELNKPLQVQSLPSRGTPGDSEVKIAVHCGGVNFADILVCQGKYQEKPPLPHVPGNEVAGSVVEVGSGVSHLKPGDRVFGLSATGGAFGEEIIGNAFAFGKLPESVPYDKAASFLFAYGTAWLGLTRQANIKPGQTVLVTAAAGGVGLAAVDLAANVFGCKVIGACGGADKCELVKQKGGFECIDYSKENVRERVKEITDGKGADIIFEIVGGKIFDDCLRSIAVEGTLVVVGFASGPIPKIPANYLLLKSCKVVGLYWGSYSLRNPPVFMESVDAVAKLLSENKITPHVSRTFPLSEVNEAMQFVLDRKSTGKVIIKVRD